MQLQQCELKWKRNLCAKTKKKQKMSILLQLQCTEDDFCQTKKNHTTSNGIVLKWESGGGGERVIRRGIKMARK